MPATLLDRAIAAIAPGWGRDRLRARLEFEALRGYAGAKTNRRTRGLKGTSGSGNAETVSDLPKLRNSSRKLMRDNPYAWAGRSVLVGYQVGAGITVRSNTKNDALDKRWNDAFEAWSARCDITGRLDFHGLTAQAAGTRVESGEALGRIVPLSRREARDRGLDVPVALQLLEPDHFDPILERHQDAQVVQGVELDGWGRPRAYHLLELHPGEPLGFGNKAFGRTIRVPAAEVMHLYRAHVSRPGQVRGVPDLAPVMTRLASLDEFEDAIIEQAKISACLVAFVTSSAPENKGPLERKDGDPQDKLRRTMAPGMIERLLLGESVEMNQPPPMAGVDVLPRHTLRAIATGLGLTYDLLTGDLTGANYSSLRAGRLTVRRNVEQDQWLMLIPRWCEPSARAFTRAAQLAGVLPDIAGEWPLEFGPPPFPFVDPLKDALAIKMQMRLGLLNWGQAVAEAGWNPRAQAAAIAEWNRILDDAGIILDGDPRRSNGSGSAQDAAQNAAIEIAATGAAS
jgi:lambda family phage portal protein